MRPRMSIRGLVRPSVGWPVHRSIGRSVHNTFVKIDEKWPFTVLSDLDNAGRGGRRDKEERGGRSDEESEK